MSHTWRGEAPDVTGTWVRRPALVGGDHYALLIDVLMINGVAFERHGDTQEVRPLAGAAGEYEWAGPVDWGALCAK